MTEMVVTLTLPVMCPEPGCSVLLQRSDKDVDGSIGVQPHYIVCHPRTPWPKVTA